MNIKLKFALFFFISTAIYIQAQAQKKDTINVGTVTGVLRDSTRNYSLGSATLSIYKIQNNELVNYQLSNNYGKYKFTQIPIGIPLQIVATHNGYVAQKRDFVISTKLKIIDLDTINIERADILLNEVVIKNAIAPMQMRGDTLEFNAAAFKLDSNAVVEDLLRKLPGVTVWSDGEITVNGKKISGLLVNGKSFFGEDNKIALQNLPKNAVEKVQVYQKKEDVDPINPKTEMNIVLKKNKRDGFFGKLGIGYGTDKRYAADGMLTYFSPKTQLSVAGALNNVNKSATNVNNLMAFNSFKGEGISNDYHTDFRQPGLNVFRGFGVTASHDFSNDLDTRQAYYKTNVLKGEFFLNDATNETLTQSATKVSLNNGEHLNQTNNSVNNGTNYGLRSNASYDKNYEHSSLNGWYNLSNNKTTSFSNQVNNSINDRTLEKSNSITQQNSSSTQNNISGGIKFSTFRFFDQSKRKNKSITSDFSYSFSLTEGTRESNNITDFKATDASQNRYFNRNYISDSKGVNHTINTSLRDFLSLFKKHGTTFKMDLVNSLAIYDFNETSNVSDLPASNTLYIPNTDLSNISHYKTIDERPGVSFSKTYSRSLDNRFSKVWRLNIFAQGQGFFQKNTALQSFQNLDRTYYYLIPSARFNYNNDQFGESKKEYTLSYSTSVQYPSISELAPLVDNSNIYNIVIGNPGLKPAYNHQLAFHYNYYDQRAKNPLNTSLDFSAGYIKNNIIDSANFDALGRTVRRYINGNGNRYANIGGTLQKSLKFKSHQFELAGNSTINYAEYQTIVNGQYYPSKSTGVNASSTITYNYKSIWYAVLGEYFSGNKTSQGALSGLSFYTWTTNASVAFAFPRSIFLNTRINFNNSKSSSVANNIYYTIWNADIGYRFLKGSTAEIKFSALDLLHQNKSVYNYVNTNSVTTRTANVLQQYFMVTLAYYPRKFGLSKK